MSLQGQGNKAYKDYLNKSMSKAPKKEMPTSGGLMNRNKSVPETASDDSSDYLLGQFMELQKLRAGLKNG